MESASTYAQIEGLSFEVTALKFLEIGQIEALKLYLLKVIIMFYVSFDIKI